MKHDRSGAPLWLLTILCAHLQEIADIDAKFRLKMAASNGRLEDAMESVALHEHKRRPQRRSVYEVLQKACPF